LRILLVTGARAELREVLQPERRLQTGAAMGGDLVDHVLDPGDVVRLVDQQRHPWPLSFRQRHLPLHLAMQHPEHEHQHRLDVVVADPSLGTVDDQDVARLDDLPHGDVRRVVEEPPDRRDLQKGRDLVARRVHPHRGLRGGQLQLVGQLDLQEVRAEVEVGNVGARLRGTVA